MTRTVTCTDCRVEFTYEYSMGSPRQRCDQCVPAHKKKQDREKSARWREANRDKSIAYQRAYHQARKDDPEFRRKRRENMLRYTYGITQAEVDALIEAQGGLCAICGGERNGPGTRLHIDHCHDTGKVRGMLCAKCNTAIGLLDNDPDRAELVARYLRT
jgi:hypothetical protein